MSQTQSTHDDDRSINNPLTPDLIQTITRPSQKERSARLTSKHIRKVNHLLDFVDTGYVIMLKVHGWILSDFINARVQQASQEQDGAQFTSGHLGKVNKLLDRIDTAHITFQKKSGRLSGIEVNVPYVFLIDDLEDK